ncbi:acyltransferase family protein [Vibrio sp. SM6]|uniref:Acyltransferase family protein n=1 Tax=Vibrio agarilyticus TaxID=2726741 RepID=A0A7X8TNA9_9VIBR|nr:acyltransferase family protein [Vibrio agarilyticus]NLS11900.1 acyltransferase family protein [Vibrio agarilyticus]
MTENSTQHIASFDLARLIAIVAIVGLHCQMALTYWQLDGVPWVGYIINQCARFAVPLFFIIAGFLIAPKVSKTPISTLKRYSAPLLKVWLIWSVIYLLVPLRWHLVLSEGYLAERQAYWQYLLSQPLNSALEGGMVHLWFIPALVCGVAIIALMARYRLLAWLLPLSIALYFYGVMAGSYITLTEWPAPFFTRNGPFFATLMIAIGFTIALRHWRLSSLTAVILTVIGMALHFTEARWLMNANVAFNSHDFLFGTPLWACGLFLLLLNYPNIGAVPWVTKLTPHILGVYVLHLLLIIVLMNLLGLNGISDLARDVILFPSALCLSFITVKALSKTPLRSVLLR